jgi:hypothetical protein
MEHVRFLTFFFGVGYTHGWRCDMLSADHSAQSRVIEKEQIVANSF